MIIEEKIQCKEVIKFLNLAMVFNPGKGMVLRHGLNHHHPKQNQQYRINRFLSGRWKGGKTNSLHKRSA